LVDERLSYCFELCNDPRARPLSRSVGRGRGPSSFGGWAAGEGFESGGGVEGLEEGLVSEDAASDAAE